MPKLTLNVESLEVQSFATTARGGGAAGTVQGYDSRRTPGCTLQYTCPTLCGATCGYTCDTCDPSCNQCVSDAGSCPCQQTEYESCWC